jgi:hypothetical protein
MIANPGGHKLYSLFPFLLSSLFFVLSPHTKTKAQLHTPWLIATIIIILISHALPPTIHYILHPLQQQCLMAATRSGDLYSRAHAIPQEVFPPSY